MRLAINLLPARIQRERAQENATEWWGSALLVSGILCWIVGAWANSRGYAWKGWPDVMIWYGVLSLPGCIFFTRQTPDKNAMLH